jgi:hypothetical protein
MAAIKSRHYMCSFNLSSFVKSCNSFNNVYSSAQKIAFLDASSGDKTSHLILLLSLFDLHYQEFQSADSMIGNI